MINEELNLTQSDMIFKIFPKKGFDSGNKGISRIIGGNELLSLLNENKITTIATFKYRKTAIDICTCEGEKDPLVISYQGNCTAFFTHYTLKDVLEKFSIYKRVR